MELEHAIDKYLYTKSQEWSIRTYTTHKNLLKALLLKTGNCELSKLDDEEIQNFLNDKKLTFMGFNSYRSKLRAFFNFWIKKKVLFSNPIFYIDPRKPNRALGEMRPEEVPKDLPIEIRREIITRFKLYSNEKYYAFVCFLAATGARPAEARQLQKQHVSMNGAFLLKTKTYVPRYVFYPPSVGEILISHAETHDSIYVWPSRDNPDKPMGETGFTKHWNMLRFGLVQPETKRPIQPYMLRHSFHEDIRGVLDPSEGCKLTGNSREIFDKYAPPSRRSNLARYEKIKHLNIFAEDLNN